MDLTETGICIMTGGRSSRMGEDKASIRFDGKETMLERTCRELSAFGYRYISVNKEQNYSYEGFITVTDDYDEIGPMGGIVSVLKRTQARNVIFVACDMPFFCLKDAKEILANHGSEAVTVPVTGGRWQPLASLYSVSCLPALESAIDCGDYRMKNVIKKLDYREFVPSDEAAYANVNTPEELKLQRGDGRTCV